MGRHKIGAHTLNIHTTTRSQQCPDRKQDQTGHGVRLRYGGHFRRVLSRGLSCFYLLNVIPVWDHWLARCHCTWVSSRGGFESHLTSSVTPIPSLPWLTVPTPASTTLAGATRGACAVRQTAEGGGGDRGGRPVIIIPTHLSLLFTPAPSPVANSTLNPCPGLWPCKKTTEHHPCCIFPGAMQPMVPVVEDLL